MDDAKDADYVVLGNWESLFYDEVWYEAQEYSKPTVTPKFVFESYENGMLMDPKNYPTSGPKKVRKQKAVQRRSRRVSRRAAPQLAFSPVEAGRVLSSKAAIRQSAVQQSTSQQPEVSSVKVESELSSEAPIQQSAVQQSTTQQPVVSPVKVENELSSEARLDLSVAMDMLKEFPMKLDDAAVWNAMERMVSARFSYCLLC